MLLLLTPMTWAEEYESLVFFLQGANAIYLNGDEERIQPSKIHATELVVRPGDVIVISFARELSFIARNAEGKVVTCSNRTTTQGRLGYGRGSSSAWLESKQRSSISGLRTVNSTARDPMVQHFGIKEGRRLLYTLKSPSRDQVTFIKLIVDDNLLRPMVGLTLNRDQ